MGRGNPIIVNDRDLFSRFRSVALAESTAVGGCVLDPLYALVGLLLMGGIVLAVLALFTWMKRSVHSGPALTVLLISAMIWVFGAVAEYLLPTLGGKIMAAKIQYVGIVTVPIASLATVLVSIGRADGFRRALPPLASISVLGFAAVVTNELHGLFWARAALDVSGPFPILAVEYGPLFWAVTICLHVQLVAAALILLPNYWRNWEPAATYAYIGFVAPWLANLVYLTRTGPWPDLDATPLGLVVTGVSFTISFHVYGSVFSTVKLAHRDVIEHIDDLILVSDNQGRILSANRAARVSLKLPPLPAPQGVALAHHPDVRELLGRPDAGPSHDLSLEIDQERGESTTRGSPPSRPDRVSRSRVP